MTTSTVDVVRSPKVDTRPVNPVIDVAIISNGLTPYRVHVHRRINEELPFIRLWSVFTHEHGTARWNHLDCEGLRIVRFGPGESASAQTDPTQLCQEWRKGGQVLRWIRTKRIRAVLVEGYNDVGRARIIASCHATRLPCFLVADSNVLADTRGGVVRLAKRLYVTTIRRLCCAILVCGSLGAAYFKAYGASTERIFYFPYEPNYEKFSKGQRAAASISPAYAKLNEARRRVLFTGRLVRSKRPDLVLSAFTRVARDHPDWDLVMVGTGELLSVLKSSLSPDVENRVKWMGFVESELELAVIYHSCDVLVLPSDYEPWGVVVNEAAAAGLAIIASSAVGAGRELVRPGVNGYIFRSGELEDLVECMREAMKPEWVDTLRSASARILDDWRRRADPVAGFEQAIRSSGLIT